MKKANSIESATMIANRGRVFLMCHTIMLVPRKIIKRERRETLIPLIENLFIVRHFEFY